MLVTRFEEMIGMSRIRRVMTKDSYASMELTRGSQEQVLLRTAAIPWCLYLLYTNIFALCIFRNLPTIVTEVKV
jgi:hypothetical protein